MWMRFWGGEKVWVLEGVRTVRRGKEGGVVEVGVDVVDVVVEGGGGTGVVEDWVFGGGGGSILRVDCLVCGSCRRQLDDGFGGTVLDSNFQDALCFCWKQHGSSCWNWAENGSFLSVPYRQYPAVVIAGQPLRAGSPR